MNLQVTFTLTYILDLLRMYLSKQLLSITAYIATKQFPPFSKIIYLPEKPQTGKSSPPRALVKEATYKLQH